MKLSIHIVSEGLKEFHPAKYLSAQDVFSFDKIQLLEEAIQPDSPCVLYVGNTAQLLSVDAERLKNVCIICIGDPEEIFSRIDQNHCNLVIISQKFSLSALVNKLFSIFENICNWAAQLDAAILKHQDYQTLFRIGGRFFGNNALLMVNSSYSVIGSNITSCPSHNRIDFILKNGYYSKEITDGLAQMGYMANGFTYKEPTIINPPNFMDCPLVVLSIHAENGIFLGFITLYLIFDELSPALFELFSYFARTMRDYYLANLNNDGSGISFLTPFETFVSDLIEHTKGDEAFLQDRAKTLRLPLDPLYRLCVIQWENFVLPQADYVRNRLRSGLHLPTFRVVLYRQSILLLLQGDIPSIRVIQEMNESLGEFGALLEICHGYASFSTGSFPLLKLNIAYQQALSAGYYGKLLSPEKKIYFYSHYYIYEMLDEYKHLYPLEDMYIQRLRLLKNPSEKHYDNLSLLRNYLLTERSISATAKIMHMHRNSVIYRLGKIQETLALDLDDPDVRLRLLISFKILEMINGSQEPLPNCQDFSKNSDLNFYE